MRLSYLLEAICDHVAHSPALVLEQTPQSSQEHTVTRLLFLGHCLGDGDEDVNGQQPDAVLVIRRKMLKQRDHLFDDNRRRHGLDEFGEVVRGLSSDHGGIVVHKLAIVLSEGLLRGGCGARVRSLVEASRGDL
jgi:hypothetical protein